MSDDGKEMHEVFITKGNVMKCDPEIKDLINSEYNCVIVHTDCHIIAQHEMKGKILCIQNIIKYEGITNTVNWLLQFNELLKTNIVEDELRFLYTILETKF